MDSGVVFICWEVQINTQWNPYYSAFKLYVKKMPNTAIPNRVWNVCTNVYPCIKSNCTPQISKYTTNVEIKAASNIYFGIWGRRCYKKP